MGNRRIDVTCPAGSEGCGKLAGAVIDAGSIGYLVSSCMTDVLEGQWHPDRLALLDLSSVKHARAWRSSTQYLTAKKSRHRTAISCIKIAEGM